MTIKYAFVFPLLFLFILSSVQAQYTLSGRVTDEEGNPYKHLKVTVFQLERSTQTDEAGRYQFVDVPEGVYALVFHHPYGEIYKSVTVEDSTQYDMTIRREIKYDEIVVRAVRSWEDAPFTKTKLQGDDLKTKHYGQDIPWLLDNTTSLVATSDAGTGIGYTGLRIRGIDPARVNISINGIPWNDAESHAVYWVDLPDLVNTISDLEIHRGVGSSTGGAGAFGAGVSINTNKIHLKPYAEVRGTLGAFDTRKGSVYLGSGLIEGQYTVDAGISQLTSAGYIDRSHAQLRNLYLSGTRISANSSLRFNLFSGQEVTGLAWYGVPYHYVMSDDDRRTFNSAGTERSLQNPYDSTVDNYAQTHFQLFYNRSYSKRSQLALAFFYTRGKGFYEQYKAEQTLSDYGLIKKDTPVADIIQKKWLANHFTGLTYSWHFKGKKRPWELILGGVSSVYFGNHFGEVARIPLIKKIQPKLPHVFYKNDATKWEHTNYAKIEWPIFSRLNAFGELQYRFVRYRFEGVGLAGAARDTAVLHHFIQPKAGLAYRRKSWSVYASFAQASKEPTRSDYRDAGIGKAPSPEHLNDIETGWSYDNGIFRSALTGFYMQYDNQLVLTGRISDVGEYVRTNIKDSYRRGIELEIGSRLWGMKWQANGAYSQNKAKAFTEYVDNWDNGSQLTREFSNKTLAFSPNLNGSVGLDYPISLGRGSLDLGVMWKYVGEQYLDNTESAIARLDAYDYLNANLGYRFSYKRLKQVTARLTLINLLNQRYSSGGWVYRFYTTHPEWVSDRDKSALVPEGDGFYSLIALYPQATRHWMLTVEMKF